MKKTNPTLKLLAVLLLASAGATTHAANIVKTNNATALNAGGSWVGGVVPKAADVAIFDNTLNGSFSSYAIGGNVTNNGISFRDAASVQTITATASSSLIFANGSAGIDMTSAAVNDFNIACLVNLGTSGGQTFNVFDSARTLTMSGVISGTGPITKTGNGTLKLSASHTYTGGTIISGGTLQLGSHNTLGAGNVTVQSGATLDLNGFGLTNKVGGFVIHIAGTGVGGNGALVDNGGSQLNFALTNLVLDADATVGGSVRFDMRPVTASALPPSMDLAGHTLTKTGASTFFLQQFSSVTDGNIIIQSGTLGVNGMSLTGSGKSVTVNSGGTFLLFRNAAVNTVSTITCPITLNDGSTVSYTGTDTADAIDQSVGSAISLSGNVTNNGTVINAVFELAGPISGSGSLTKIGAGTLLLSGASSYSGATTVTAGTATLGSAWSSSGDVTVSDSASIGFKPATHNAVVNLSSLTLGSAGNTTANFDMGGFANPSGTVANITNALTLNGTTTVNLANTTGLTSGTFKLITFGSIAGSGGFAVGVSPGFTATLATNGNSIEITLQKAALAWRGTSAGTWQVSAPANLDWYDLLLSAPAGYVDGVPVIFDDSGSATPTVNITETVQPASVTVSNTSTAYVFSGSGKISGPTGLTKTGAGTLTVGLVNDYSGTTTISQGTLQLGVVNAIPTSTVPVTLNGTLDLNGNNQMVAGLNGSGTLTNTSGTSAEIRFGAGSAGTFSGVIADNGSGNVTVYKTGSGYQTLTGNNAFSGGTTMNGGSLYLGSDGALGSGPISLSFTADVASDSSTPHTFANDLNFSGSSSKNIGDAVNNGVLTFSGAVGFGGGSRNVSFNSDIIFSGTVGSGALVKEGTGKLTMDAVNTCTATTINGGVLAGSGSFSGPVAVNGATLSPGTGIGTLTINNNLSLAGTSTTVMELSAAGNTNDMVAGLTGLTYNGTLTVTNLAGTLASGQSFQLFSSSAVPSGNFSTTNLPALTGGLAWNWNPTNGTLAVVSGIATNPTNITFNVSGGTLNLTWPGDHLGWIAQSNSVNLANTNFWFDIAGSETATNLSITISPSLTNVFYRIRQPN